MKITDVRHFIVHPGWRKNWVFVRIETDAGITGWGEAFGYNAIPATKTAIETFETAGIPTQAAEAMAFSLMGRNTLLGAANHLPRTTGAAHACVLGEVAYATGAPRR